MIRRDGSEDEVNPLWDADQDRPTDNDRATPCDAGHPGCMGLAAVVLAVPYLETPLWLCASCAVVEQREDEPSVGQLYEQKVRR